MSTPTAERIHTKELKREKVRKTKRQLKYEQYRRQHRIELKKAEDRREKILKQQKEREGEKKATETKKGFLVGILEFTIIKKKSKNNQRIKKSKSIIKESINEC